MNNENSLRNLKPRWQPGESGNPNGRPARARLTEQFISDLSTTWGQHGAKVLQELATKQPGQFAALAAKLVPQDVQLTLEARLPGNLDPADWSIVLEVMGAIKQALPDANSRDPGEVTNHVLEALRTHDAKVIEPK